MQNRNLDGSPEGNVELWWKKTNNNVFWLCFKRAERYGLGRDDPQWLFADRNCLGQVALWVIPRCWILGLKWRSQLRMAALKKRAIPCMMVRSGRLLVRPELVLQAFFGIFEWKNPKNVFLECIVFSFHLQGVWPGPSSDLAARWPGGPERHAFWSWNPYMLMEGPWQGLF